MCRILHIFCVSQMSRALSVADFTRSRPILVLSPSSWKQVSESYRIKGDKCLASLVTVSTLSLHSQIDFIRPMIRSRLFCDFQNLYCLILSHSSCTRMWMSTFMLPHLIPNSLKVLMSALHEGVKPALCQSRFSQ